MSIPTTIFFAEHAEPGTFSRVNLVGCILTDDIIIPEAPYKFRTNLIILKDVEPEILDQSIQIKFVYTDPTGSFTVLAEGELEIAEAVGKRDDSRSTNRLVSVVPFEIDLPGFGQLEARIKFQKSEELKRWRITKGDGPLTGSGSPRKASGIITAANPFDIDALIGSALKDIALCDCYIFAPLLQLLVNLSSSDTHVRILTSRGKHKNGAYPEEEAIRKEKMSVLAKYPNVEVRFSKEFHDRVVIIDTQEVYIFGHSISALNKGRVSRYSKVLDAGEHGVLKEEFEKAWEAAVLW